MTLSAIAIDDEPRALEVVQMLAAKVVFLDLKCSFTDAFEAIPYLQQHPVDLIFLDIKMPDISGIEFVNCLQQVPMVIFSTAYSEYAVKGFELNAVDYLLKPYSLVRFTQACNKALELKKWRQGQLPQYVVSESPFLFIKTGYEQERIMLNDILYLEAEGNYVAYILKNRKLLCRQSISEALAQLPDRQFVRLHRSYVVAIGHIQKISRQSVWIHSVEIPVGASYEGTLAEIRTLLSL
ncbi:LytR/AlgR family response regulator transcription factor [Arundinibacter roseus]|uniref:Response regulator transcription factor n=1 Tax=Arundinibacter roseus TaxID=2070510 RepID=A0A4R4KGH4_9BACT|nr:LytTR family DNA-binding domain-containing protein [Arundinibacter roseus]TDB65976.1 response regulator transcription factor [Arundinibacter roseus]